MIGAIIGDLNGSKYEFHNTRSKEFELFQSDMHLTDDSIMTIAVMKTFNEACSLNRKVIFNEDWQTSFKKTLINNFVEFYKKHPYSGYGGRFHMWLNGFNNYKPYRSYGNGAAMRISPVGWVAQSEEEVVLLSRLVTEVTHNHPEGIKGAEATAMAIYLAKTGMSKENLKQRMIEFYYPEIATFNYEILRKTYGFSEKCQDSVPQAIYCFLISNDFEDCLRTTISIGGDCDTTSAVSCAIAEAYYGLPSKFEMKTKHFLRSNMFEVITQFKELTLKGGK